MEQTQSKSAAVATDGASASSSHLDASRTPGQMQASAAIVLDANAVVLCDAQTPPLHHCPHIERRTLCTQVCSTTSAPACWPSTCKCVDVAAGAPRPSPARSPQRLHPEWDPTATAARTPLGPVRCAAPRAPRFTRTGGSATGLDASLGRVAAHRPAGRCLCPAQGWASLHRGRDGVAAHVAPAGVRTAPRHPWRVVDQRWPASRPALSGSGSPGRLRAPERYRRGAAWPRIQPTGSTLLVGAPPRWLVVAR